MKTKSVLLNLLFLLLPLAIWAQQSSKALGVWKMVDDRTGIAKSHIKLYDHNGKVYGKVVKTLHPSANHLCDKCTDYRKNQPMLGMIIIEGLEYKDGYLKNGKVLFPKQGKWYDVEIWLQPGDANTLVLRGYWGPFFRTQYWTRVE
jgi:uncharacterized protein (DUF2147 family)